MDEHELWDELCLCILSSNVPSEMARSAYLQLQAKGLLDTESLGNLSKNEIAHELGRPIYLPRRRNGQFRRYRFPNVRASNIVRTHDVLYQQGPEIKGILLEDSSDMVRELLARTLPGIGMKEASHFLRNVKYSDSLAIIDSHVIRFLEENLGLPLEFKGTNGLSLGGYIELENVLKQISANLEIRLGVLDMAIWNSMREGSQRELS